METFGEGPIALIFPSWITISPPAIGGWSTGRSVALTQAIGVEIFFVSLPFEGVCPAKIEGQRADPDKIAVEVAKNFLRVFNGWILEVKLKF